MLVRFARPVSSKWSSLVTCRKRYSTSTIQHTHSWKANVHFDAPLCFSIHICTSHLCGHVIVLVHALWCLHNCWVNGENKTAYCPIFIRNKKPLCINGYLFRICFYCFMLIFIYTKNIASYSLKFILTYLKKCEYFFL